MYVCMYVCIYIYIYIHTHSSYTHMYVVLYVTEQLRSGTHSYILLNGVESEGRISRTSSASRLVNVLTSPCCHASPAKNVRATSSCGVGGGKPLELQTCRSGKSAGQRYLITEIECAGTSNLFRAEIKGQGGCSIPAISVSLSLCISLCISLYLSLSLSPSLPSTLALALALRVTLTSSLSQGDLPPSDSHPP